MSVYFCSPSWLDSTMFFNIRSRSFQSCRFALYTSPIFYPKHFPTKPLLRTTTFLPKPRRKSVILDKSHHRLVYNFPYIAYIGAFLKSKISVPVASLTLAPVLYFLEGSNASMLVTILSGCLYFITGSVISKYSGNLVGKIYVNKEDEITEVIMSSIDENGRRIDRIHKLEDLINIDYPTKFSRALGFIAIGVENSNIYYKINKRACQFVDEKACDYVFGFAWQSIEKETSESEDKESQKVEEFDKRLPEK